MHSSRPLLASAAPRSLGWHLPPLGEPTLNRGRASVFKGCATPPGENAGQPGRIGLSKVCQIFGTARVDTEFLLCAHSISPRVGHGLDYIRSEIEHMRLQVARQKKILQLQRAGIPTTSAEALLQRMLHKIDSLCAERDRLKAELPEPKGRVLGGRQW